MIIGTENVRVFPTETSRPLRVSKDRMQNHGHQHWFRYFYEELADPPGLINFYKRDICKKKLWVFKDVSRHCSKTAQNGW